MVEPPNGPTRSHDGDGTTGVALGRHVWRRLRAWWPLAALAAAIIVASVLTAARHDTGLPLDPASTGPDGTRGLVDLLASLGRDVATVDPGLLGATEADVVLLLRDQLSDAERTALRQRVDDGARLVVADPSSPLAAADPAPLGLLDRVLERGCQVPALRDVREVRPALGAAFPVPADGTGCFLADDGAWLVIAPVGRGHIVSLGGPDVLVNSELGRADHAVLAAQLLTPADGDELAVVRPVLRTAADAQDSLFDLVPAGVRVLVLQLLVAFGVLVLWRARRLGPALVESTPVTLANAEQTRAVGALLARNDARGAAAERIAADTRRRLARQLGLHRGAGVDAVATAVAGRTRHDGPAVVATLAPETPADDAELLRLTAALTELERDVAASLSADHEESIDVH